MFIIKILSMGLFLSLNLYANSLFLNQFFNDKACDKVLTNGGYFKTCYDYNLKSAKYVAYSLSGVLVNEKNIKKRPSFREDKNIPKRYRSTSKDFVNSGYDRGHLVPVPFIFSKYGQEKSLKLYVVKS